MMSFKLLQRGRLIPVPPVETAIAFLDQERADAARLECSRPACSRPSRRRIVGSPETVRSGIEAVAKDYGADEVMVVTITYDHAARRRSYELIADAFGLSCAAEASRGRASAARGTAGGRPGRSSAPSAPTAARARCRWRCRCSRTSGGTASRSARTRAAPCIDSTHARRAPRCCASCRTRSHAPCVPHADLLERHRRMRRVQLRPLLLRESASAA